MRKYFILISAFLIIGALSPQLSDIVCYFWLDNLHCYFQTICSMWDAVEYWVAHKLLSYLFYYVGWYGFVGSVLYMIEERYLGNVLSTLLSNVPMNTIAIMIVSAFIVNTLSSLLYLDVLFESLYHVFN